MYSVVEFENDEGVAVVSTKWLTPRKREVYWPPVKDNRLFKKLLTDTTENIEINNWKLYNISRIFYETDSLDKANEKAKQAELTSDLQSESSELSQIGKRKRIPKKVYSDEDSEEENEGPIRPPPVKRIASSQIFSENRNSPTPSTSSRRLQDSVENSPCCSPKTSRSLNNLDTQQVPFRILLQIKEQNSQLISQNKEIIQLLKKKLETPTTLLNLNDLDLNLPVKTDLELQNLENFLNVKENFELLVQYLSKIGGRDTTSTTNRIIKELIDDSLTKDFNYCGQRAEKSNKRSFRKLRLRDLIIAAVKQGYPAATEETVEKSIKTYLKHAPERFKKNKNA